MTRLAARALLAAVFWPSLFFLWFLAPLAFLTWSTVRGTICDQMETRAEFLAAANGTIPLLLLQNLLYAVPIACLVVWSRLFPDPVRMGRVALSLKLFVIAGIAQALWAYGSSLVCDGSGRAFFSPLWQVTGYLPIISVALNLPLYVLVFSLGRAFSMRDDIPEDDAAK